MACVLEPEIDQPTADLIVQLQLQDAGLYFETSKGKSRDPTDEELAFQLQNEELENISQLLVDRRMALSFAAAVQADGPILAEKKVEEENVSKDRRIARQWTDDGFPTFPDDFGTESTALDDETLAKLQILFMSDLEGYHNTEGVGMGVANGTETEQAESSTRAAQRNRQPSRIRQCVACREQAAFVNVARAPCQHEYCRSCLEGLFKASMTDESLFPPRCCRQPINMSVARIFLNADLVQQYETKKVEFETPNRTYCYSVSCAAFIGTSHITGEVATCPDCRHTTCTNCKERAHTGDCPSDTSMQQLLATAQENGWQRCYKCWRMVELDHGCNHMICICSAQFCYNCGEEWKNCGCEQWNEHRLLARAYQIIDRDAHHPLPAAPPPNIDEPRPEGQIVPETDESHSETQEARPEESNEGSHATAEASLSAHFQTPQDSLVARTIQGLRENHECGHDSWKYIRGPHICEECSHLLAGYIFECHQCRLQACNRCRWNRL
ncbi:IBR finger domain protein [Aspergillus cavernicola]|uniref:RBR-type E3 ubiquitin transferase n=1 Tax=Aspergillus cavernicola TaxID=176166 RepID=A0ABR4IK88_9EURO